MGGTRRPGQGSDSALSQSNDHTPTSQMNLIGEGAGGLSDDEAIALWDRLMASVRLRVVDR